MALSNDPTDNVRIGTQGLDNGLGFNGISFAASSGTPAQINIGGNARVHLGDHFDHGIKPALEQSEPSATGRPTDSAMVSSAMQTIEFSLLVLSSGQQHTSLVYGPLHAQLAYNRLLSHRTTLLGNIDTLVKPTSKAAAALTKVGTRVQDLLDIGDSVLVELLTGCANVAYDLATVLDEVYTITMRQPNNSCSSLGEMISNVSSGENTVANTLEVLKILSGKAMIALLILLR